MSREKTTYSIGIIGGSGIMGKFFHTLFAQAGCSVFSWGRSSDQSLEDFCKHLDIVVVSVPIDVTESVIKSLGEFLTPDQCITDLTSLKEFPMQAMQEKTKARYFGMHPMFAPPVSGIIKGQNIVFCEGTAPDEQLFFEELFTENGAVCLSTTASEHDTLMTIVQGLSHFLDITFLQTLHKTNLSLETVFASRSPAYALKMMIAGRTLYQDANLYGNIQIQNPKNIKTLQTFFEVAQELFSTIEKKDLPGFEKIFETEKQYLGKYAEKSQQESDIMIDFLSQQNFGNAEKNKERHRQLFKKEKNTSQKNTIGILGPQNTFSAIAGHQFFGREHSLELFPSIPSVFSAYKKGRISTVFVPIENILHGSVVETIDGIVDSDLMIQKIFEMKITPSLFVAPGVKKENISRIFSHPQALAQCSDFLEQQFPEVEFVPMPSTAGGVEKILNTYDSAAIGAPQTGEQYNVVSLFENIANTNTNATRFAFLTPEKNIKTPKESVDMRKNSGESTRKYEGGMIFSFQKDSPGSLESVLHLFSEKKINLTKIESRPTGKGFGEYTFFVTYMGSIPLEFRKTFFTKLSGIVASFRFLGEFEITENPLDAL